MTSVTVRRLHKPSLLFYESGGGFGCAGWAPVIGGAAEQRNCPIRIKLANLLAPNAFEVCARQSPRLDPAPTSRKLLRCPSDQCRRFLLHELRIIENAAVGKHEPKRLDGRLSKPHIPIAKSHLAEGAPLRAPAREKPGRTNCVPFMAS